MAISFALRVFAINLLIVFTPNYLHYLLVLDYGDFMSDIWDTLI